MKGSSPVLSVFAQPIECYIRDDLRGVALDGGIAPRGDEVGVEVVALPRQDHKIVDPLRIIPEVQLSEHCRLVPPLLKQLREGRLGGIEGHPVIDLAVKVAVLAGQDYGPWRGHRSSWSRRRY